MEVDLVFHLIRQEDRIIRLQAHKVALDQRRVHIIDPLILHFTSLAPLDDHIGVPIDVGKITPPEIVILVPAQADHPSKIYQPPVFWI